MSGDAEGCCYLPVGTGEEDLVYIKTQSTDIYISYIYICSLKIVDTV